MSESEDRKSEDEIIDPVVNEEGSVELPDQQKESVEEGSSDDIGVVESILGESVEDEEIVFDGDPEQSELEKYKDIAARSQADLENYRKRMARERTEAIQYANFSLLSTLLPVIDNFEMGLQAAKNEGETSVIYQGMTMVQKQLYDFLTENRVEQIEVTEGAEFDPNIHEAIKQEESETVEEGKIIYAMRKGYRLKDRLLRPANVVVSKGAATEQSSEQS
ncbi:MAG: nucleotide exchange factor GrpE [Verrucomicrobiales bacterium]|nr:nucleotide exchange factor GrpE [Verrucomicrobiales bacterium]